MAQQRGVSRVVTAQLQREGGGFVVRRPLGVDPDQIDPCVRSPVQPRLAQTTLRTLAPCF